MLDTYKFEQKNQYFIKIVQNKHILINKKDADFTNKMLENLKLDDNEKEIINPQNAMYLDIFKELKMLRFSKI